MNQFKTEQQQKFYSMVGLKPGQNVYNVLDQFTDANQMFNLSQTQAKDYRDVAKQSDVDSYYKLFNLANRTVDPTTGQYTDVSKTDPNLGLSKVGNLESAVSGNTNLSGQIADADEAFYKNIAAFNSNYGTAGGGSIATTKGNAKDLYESILKSGSQDFDKNKDVFSTTTTGNIPGFSTADDYLYDPNNSAASAYQKQRDEAFNKSQQTSYNQLMEYLRAQGAFNKV